MLQKIDEAADFPHHFDGAVVVGQAQVFYHAVEGKIVGYDCAARGQEGGKTFKVIDILGFGAVDEDKVISFTLGRSPASCVAKVTGNAVRKIVVCNVTNRRLVARFVQLYGVDVNLWRDPGKINGRKSDCGTNFQHPFNLMIAYIVTDKVNSLVLHNGNRMKIRKTFYLTDLLHRFILVDFTV